MDQIQPILDILIHHYTTLKLILRKLYVDSCLYQHTKSFDIFDTVVVVLVIAFLLNWACHHIRLPHRDYNQCKYQSIIALFAYIKASIFMTFVNYFPGVNSMIERKKLDALKSFSDSMDKMTNKKTFRLPENGMSHEKIVDRLEEWTERDSEHQQSGRISGSIYVMNDKKFVENVQDFCKHFLYSNPMHADLFPASRQMEAEVIKMTGDLFGQEKESIGILTTGGTESILLAMLAYRNWGENKRGITHPNIVIPETAHAAFYRAGEYFKIQIRIAKVNQTTFTVDVNDLKSKIDNNTVCIVGSLPNFPYGTYDPIEQLAGIAKRKNIGLHVDACLGGFTAVFAKDHGVDLGKFDFTLDGVTSISCDQHKHGVAPKGVSTVLFKTRALRQQAFFAIATWSGGAYAVPSTQGSKCGVGAAGAWFVMQSLGKKKYVELSKKVMDGTKQLAKWLNEIPEIQVCGNPQINVVCFVSKHKWLNAYAIHQILVNHGWNINSTQNPAGIHISITHQNVNNLKQYVQDIKSAIAEIKADPAKYKKGGDMGTLYGTTQKIPDQKFAGEALKLYLESLLKI